MKSLIVCTSMTHGNTRRVADRMAEVLQADVVAPDDVDATRIAEYDIVGWGSGVYFMAVHPSLLRLIRELPHVSGGTAAFTFFTSGARELPIFGYSKQIRRELAAKGFRDLGSFSCRGFDTVGPLRFVGGVNKGRPNADDLDKAAAFAMEVSVRAARTAGQGSRVRSADKLQHNPRIQARGDRDENDQRAGQDGEVHRETE